MKIFVAGATGVLGRPLLPRLIAAGHQVTGTTRNPDRATLVEAAGARPAVVNVYDRDALFKLLDMERPEAVIHLLTDLNTTDPGGNARIRIEGTRNLVDAARASGVGIMVAESISFMYGPGSRPATEDEPLDMEAPAVRRAGVEAVASLEEAVAEMRHGVVLRYALLYGPGTMYAPAGRVGQQVRAGTMAASEGISSFLHVEDAAQATQQALDWPAGIYNVADDEPAPGTTWLPIYAQILGASAPTQTAPATPTQRGASNAKARGQGWQPRYASWREGFRAALGGA